MNESEVLKLLKRRVERLIEEYEINAPSVIKYNELRLIKSACLQLEQLLYFEEADI